MGNLKTGAEIAAALWSSEGDFVAAEAITEGDALAMIRSIGFLDLVHDYTTDTSSPSASGWVAQSFVTSASAERIHQIRVNTYRASSGNVTFALRSSLTGADLWTGTTATSALHQTHLFTLDLDVDPSTTYYLVQKGGGEWEYSSSYDYTGGDTFTSADSGASWGAAESDKTYYFQVWEAYGSEYEICKAGSGYFDDRLNLIGFAMADAAIGEAVDIHMLDFVTLSGLTAETDYYLSDTPGALATSAGTYERFVGRALTTDKLVRKRGIVSPLFSLGTSFTMPANGFVISSGGGSAAQINAYGQATNGESGHCRPVGVGEDVTRDTLSGYNVYAQFVDYHGHLI